MIFKKKKKEIEIAKAVIPKEESKIEEGIETKMHEEIEKREELFRKRNVEWLREVEDKMKIKELGAKQDELTKLKKLCLTVYLMSSDKELRSWALRTISRIKLYEISKGTVVENLIKLCAGIRLSDDELNELISMGVVETVYRIPSGVELKIRSKEELSKKIEELLEEDYDVVEDVKKALTDLPLKVEEDQAELAGKLYEFGVFDVYLLPKGLFDDLLLEENSSKLDRAVKEAKEIIEKLPEDLRKFLEL